MIKLSDLIFLLFLLVGIVRPQYRNIEFEHLTVEDGLAGNRVYCILQDSKDFMWFGTEFGLSKYDGYSFTNYRPDSENPNSIGHIFVWSIMEDYKGDIWIGTYGGGLHKFDHEKEIFIIYRNENDDPNSLSNNFVSAICQSPADSGKTLWVGTRWGGLNKLDLNIGKFYNPQNSSWNFSSINTKNIFDLYFDHQGTLWIGTVGSGVIQYDIKTENYVCYTNNPKDENSLSNNYVRTVYQDKLGNIWIGTEGGLNRFDKNKKKFTRYFCEPNDKNSLSDNNIESIFQDKSGYLWIGTFNGLNILNPETGKVERIHSNLNDDHGLSHDYITTIYQDASGIFWIGTLGGINKYNPATKKFKHFQITIDNYSKTNINSVRSIQEDKTNNEILWIGSSGSGLIKYNRDTNKYIHYFYQNTPIFVRSIYQNHHVPDALWIATWGQGLIKLDKNLNHIYKRVFWSQNPIYKDAYHINTIYEIKDGLILLGTSFGLYQFDCFTEKYICYLHNPDDPGSLSHHAVTSICSDRSGQLWIGTHGGGLNKFILKSDAAAIDLRNKGNFIHFKNNPENPKSISSNTITCVYVDKKNIIWIGTEDGGLNKLVSVNSHEFNGPAAEFVHFREKDGLPSDVIMGILEDNIGNLWLSTNNGISKFDPANETFRNYDIRDGLQGNEFNRLACFKAQNAEIYFGGTNGFNVFHPDSIKDNPQIPSVVITEFHIFNKPIKPGGKSQIKKSISETEQIILSHNEAVFSFEFAALEYTISGKNKYAYKMEGVDPDWVYTDALRRFATYTNLDPGEYIFRVKGSNNDGVWNEQGTSIKILILPPWWKTTWAYLFYLVTLTILLVAARQYDRKRQKLKHQLELEQVHSEKLAEVDRIKSRFFANISHEFRTPLTLIQGPLKQLLSLDFKENVKEQFRMILRNSDRLLSLINQLLDLSKLEAGRMKLQVQCKDIVPVFKGLVMSFASLAERKQITLKFRSSEDSLQVYFDRDKLEKIFNNLLSNAFKFTPQDGVVEVGISKQPPLSPFSKGEGDRSPLSRGDSGGCLQISVSNTGPGIPADQINKIFDRFYQVEDSYTKESEGTGIGLALAKEFVELHHGKIWVESTTNKKTTFTVYLPLGREHLSENEIVQRKEVEKIHFVEAEEKVFELNNTGHGLTLAATKLQTTIDKSKPIILIVEDNRDVRQYIGNNMLAPSGENLYQIIEAEDGKQGFKKAVDKIPDLIISDVMMPEMDGFELCKKLKSDERTSHIPVILLTARAAKADKIEGFETGADDYIPKPFDADELLVRIKNLIEQRRKLRERFSREVFLIPEKIAITSMDEVFLKRAINIAQENISDQEFGVDFFSKKIGLSRSQLHRKIHALTDQSVSQFIRSLRLRKAVQLLEKRAGTISEIAYQVGFNSSAYFTKCFHEQFNLSPSDYMSQQNIDYH